MASREPAAVFVQGRFVGGSLYQGKSLDDNGQQKLFKSGAKKGQPRTDYSFGVAIAKTQGHWGTEPSWGQTIWAEGHACWPAGQATRKDFAWKIIDGDSAEPNKNMKRPCDQEGYPGHWILWFSGTNPPPLAVAIGAGAVPVWETRPGFCNPGDYIQVNGSVSSNESDQTSGMYLNFNGVCMIGYGQRIVGQGLDLATAGFGVQGNLPAGASAVPLGNAPPVPGAPAASPSIPAVPAVPAVPAAVPSATPAAPPVPTPTAVVPNPAILDAPSPVAVPPAPAAVPVPPTPPAPAKVLLNGGVYADWIAAGWTDDSLRAAGHMA